MFSCVCIDSGVAARVGSANQSRVQAYLGDDGQIVTYADDDVVYQSSVKTKGAKIIESGQVLIGTKLH